MSGELPGYDAWLDNYGNPGIQEDPMYPRWMIEEQIDVTQITKHPDSYLVERVSNKRNRVVISFGSNSTDPDNVDERTILLNGEYVDLGDDMIDFISVLDEYQDQHGELGKTIRQQPFKADDADH
jgi:hypothetical protein